MKHTLVIAALLIFTSFAHASSYNESIIGSWLHSYKSGEINATGVTEYKKGGRFNGFSVITKDKAEIDRFVFTGTWSISGSQLTMETTYIGNPKLKEPVSLTAEIIEITEEKFTIKTEEGLIVSDLRIKE